MPVSKLISYVFYCFMNFLCISLFFLPFFLVKFVANLKRNNAKTNSFQPLRVKISIFIWTMWKKTQFALILYIKSHFGAIFGPTCMYKKLRNFRTVPPGVTNLVSKCAGNLKENSHKVSRWELARCRVIARNVEGGGGLLGPSLYRVKVAIDKICR